MKDEFGEGSFDQTVVMFKVQEELALNGREEPVIAFKEEMRWRISALGQ